MYTIEILPPYAFLVNLVQETTSLLGEPLSTFIALFTYKVDQAIEITYVNTKKAPAPKHFFP